MQRVRSAIAPPSRGLDFTPAVSKQAHLNGPRATLLPGVVLE